MYTRLLSYTKLLISTTFPPIQQRTTYFLGDSLHMHAVVVTSIALNQEKNQSTAELSSNID